MIVYGLVDPRTKELRYVGETIRPMARRLTQHIRSAKEKTTPPVNAWLRGLISSGLSPEVIELDRCDSSADMHEAETFWIAYTTCVGASLLNIAPGGSTRVGYRHSAETREKWCRERRGEKGSNYGKRRTPEQNAASADRVRRWIASNGHPMQGRKMSPESRQKISEGRRGVLANTSPEGLRRIAEARQRNWANPLYRAKMSRPGLSNPTSKTVLVDGVEYGYAELARHLGLCQSTVSARIREMRDCRQEFTAADFASRRKKA